MLYLIVGIIALFLVYRYWSRTIGWFDDKLDESVVVRKATNKKHKRVNKVKAQKMEEKCNRQIIKLSKSVDKSKMKTAIKQAEYDAWKKEMKIA